MKLVCARLCDGVDDASRGTPVLGREVWGINLKLTNRCLTDWIRAASASSLFREKALVIVAAINGAVIQQAGDTAKTNQTEVAIGCGCRCKNREVGPAASIDREFVDRCLIQVAGKILLRGVDDRSFSSYVDGACYRSNRQRHLKVSFASNFDSHGFDCSWTEPSWIYSDGVKAGLEIGNLETSGVIGGGRIFLIGSDVFYGDGRTCYDLFGWIRYDAANCAGGRRLRQGNSAKTEQQYTYAKQLYDSGHLGNSLVTKLVLIEG